MRNKINIRAIAIAVLVASTTLTAQTPQPSATATESRAAAAEANAAAARLLATTHAVRADALERDLTRKSGELAEAEQRVTKRESVIAGLNNTLVTVSDERDKALQKIGRANRRWNCRILHLGCIGEK